MGTEHGHSPQKRETASLWRSIDGGVSRDSQTPLTPLFVFQRRISSDIEDIPTLIRGRASMSFVPLLVLLADI